MNKLIMVVGAVTLVGMMTGCVTHPLSMKNEAYDGQKYDNSKDRPIPSGAYTIVVDAKTKASGSTDKIYEPAVTAAAYSSAIEKLSGLGWFKVVDRKNAAKNAAEAIAAGRETDITADLVLHIESSYAFMHKEKNRDCNLAKDAGLIRISSDYRLEDTATSKPILAEIYEQSGERHRKSQDVKRDIPSLMKKSTDQFAKVIASRFLPGGPVLETRGSGKVARIGLGKNYNLKVGSKVDFFVDEPTSSGTFDRRVFATGTVLEDGLQAKQCWVEVDNFEVANVHVNHSAKVQE